MKEVDYAITRADKIHRALSLGVLIVVLVSQIAGGIPPLWYRFAAGPVFATALIWYSDPFGCALPWKSASRDIRIVGWAGLLVMAAIYLL